MSTWAKSPSGTLFNLDRVGSIWIDGPFIKKIPVWMIAIHIPGGLHTWEQISPEYPSKELAQKALSVLQRMLAYDDYDEIIQWDDQGLPHYQI